MGDAANLEEATTKAIDIEREFNIQEPEELTETVKALVEPKVADVKIIKTEEQITCQICNKPKHTAKTCWYRASTQSQHTQHPSAAPQQEQTANKRPPWAEPMKQASSTTAMPRSTPQPSWLSQTTQIPNNILNTQNNNQQQENNQTNNIGICNYCKEPGHWKAQCEKRRIRNEKIQQAVKGMDSQVSGAPRES